MVGRYGDESRLVEPENDSEGALPSARSLSTEANEGVPEGDGASDRSERADLLVVGAISRSCTIRST